MIKVLQAKKSKIVSAIFNLHRTNNHRNNPTFSRFKSLLANVKTLLKQHFDQLINDYWHRKIATILEKESHDMFPQINKIFLKKAKTRIRENKVSTDDPILNECGLNRQELLTLNNEHIIINDTNKLRLIGRHFEKTHSQNDNLSTSGFINEVQDENRTYLTRTATSSHTTFDEKKKADMLDSDNTEGVFTTIENLRKIFRKLNMNNKKSFGLDGIPNVILKHFTKILVRQYCILFDNALNNQYFPT